MPTLLLCVNGMKGREDEERVQDALAAEPGVFGAVANHRDACVEIDYADDRVTIDRLAELVDAEGFEADLAA